LHVAAITHVYCHSLFLPWDRISGRYTLIRIWWPSFILVRTSAATAGTGSTVFGSA
jgi:hypothetical protein